MIAQHTTTRFMQYPAASAALVLAVAAMTPCARADIVNIAWDAGGRFERSLKIAPGKFVEMCVQLPAGLKIGWSFEASAPLDFNVHFHVGKEVVFAANLTAVATARDTLATKTDQDYCWMWSNKTAASVTAMVKLHR